MRRPLYTIIVAIALLCGCKQEISGTYLSQSVSDIGCLQLVRTPDNHLAGQLQDMLLKADGKLERNTVSLIGAVNGTDVVLTLADGFFGLGATTLSGSVRHNTLTLTGFQNGSLMLQRSSLNDCAIQTSLLEEKAQSLTQARDAAEARRKAIQSEQASTDAIDATLSRMKEFESEADMHLARMPAADAGYGQITERIAEYVGREKQLIGQTNSEVARSQLSIAAVQASFSTDQLHYSARDLEASLHSNVEPIVERADYLERECKQKHAPTLLPFDQQKAHDDACQRLFTSDPLFREKLKAVANGLDHAEEIYRREKDAQQKLLESVRGIE